MFVIVVTDGTQDFFFAGWEGSDTAVRADELTYWRADQNHVETYEYSDIEEVRIERELLLTSDLYDAIGLPDNFVIEDAVFNVLKVRESHD